MLVAVLVFSVGLVHAGEKYNFDLAHSSVGFSVKHLVISNTKGRFNDFSGTIVFDERDPSKSSVEVVIKAASIDTENERRDNHLKSADFLDVENHPEITFVSKEVRKTEGGWEMVGDLTIRGVTKEVVIPFTVVGPVEVFGGKRLGAEGTLTINRHDFGVAWNRALEGGGFVVGDDVKISLEVEAIKDDGAD